LFFLLFRVELVAPVFVLYRAWTVDVALFQWLYNCAKMSVLLTSIFWIQNVPVHYTSLQTALLSLRDCASIPLWFKFS